MGVNVELQNERGERLDAALDEAGGLAGFISEIGESHVHLSAIDLYGDTTFNRLQLPRVLDEVSDVRTSASPEVHALLDEVVRLANAALDEPHRYLKFIGD